MRCVSTQDNYIFTLLARSDFGGHIFVAYNIKAENKRTTTNK